MYFFIRENNSLNLLNEIEMLGCKAADSHINPNTKLDNIKDDMF